MKFNIVNRGTTMNYINSKQNKIDGVFNNEGEISIVSHLLRNVESEKKELMILILELFMLILISVLVVFFSIQVMLPYLLVLLALTALTILI